MSLLKTKSSTNTNIDKLKRDLMMPKSTTPLNLRIDSELHDKFKIKCTTEKIAMTEIIVQAIIEYLEE